MKNLRRPLLALAFGLSASVVAYVALRLVERALFPEPNPVIVIWSDRSRFGWRALIACYLGGAAIFGGYALASRSLEAASTWLFRLTVVAASLLAALGAVVP